MNAVWTFIVAHHVAILSAAGTILAASVTNRWVLKHPKVETWLHVLIGVMAFLERTDASGLLKWPLTLAEFHSLTLNSVAANVAKAISGEATAPAKQPAPLPPPPAAMILAPLFLALLSCFMANPARADGFSAGPTVPLVRYDLSGSAKTAILAAGAGYQLSYGALPITMGGHVWDRLGFSIAAFIGHGNGVTTGSLAGLVCTLSSLLCAGVGYDIYTSAGPREPFLLFSLSVAFGLSPSAQSSSSLPASGPAMLMPAAVPANTVEF